MYTHEEALVYLYHAGLPNTYTLRAVVVQLLMHVPLMMMVQLVLTLWPQALLPTCCCNHHHSWSD